MGTGTDFKKVNLKKNVIYQKLKMVGFFLWWKKYFKYKKGLGNAYPA
jgi:hypothetical protein